MTTSSLILTHHAQERMQQRSVSRQVIEWVLRFGDRMRCHGGTLLFYLGRRAWRRLRNAGLARSLVAAFERARDVALVVAGDDPVLVTVVRTRDISRLRDRR